MLLNRDRAMKLMDEYRLDALVATTMDNVTYLSDYHALEFILEPRAQRYAILPRDEGISPTLVVPVAELEPLAEEGTTWFPDIRGHGVYHILVLPGAPLTKVEANLAKMRSAYFGSGLKPPLQALIAALKDKHLDRARIGLDPGNLEFAFVDSLRKELPGAEFVPSAQVFYEARMVKTPEEIRRLKISSQINEEVLIEVEAMVKEGTPWWELYKHYCQGLAARGAELLLWTGGHGPLSAASFTKSNTTIRKGDLLLFDTGCLYQRYASDTCRIMAVGDPGPRAWHCYRAIMEGYRVGISMIKPGAMASSIYRAAHQAVRDAGLPTFTRHNLGHSIGFENHEPPVLGSPESLLSFKDYPLEENMVLCIEMPYYELGTGGISVEDTFLVTKGGWEYITQMSRELPVV